MKAAQLIKYDKKDPLIEIRDVNSQPLGAHDLLIRTKTAAVNPLDNLISHGDLKLVVPYKLPQTMGNEFVGIIEKIGPKVTNFKIGDRIFARNPVNNAFAQKIVINEKAVAKAPEYLSDQEAAAVPLTTLTAMQAFQLLNLKAGQTLFISGGSGSFGAMAIPLSIAQGYKVITTGNETSRARLEKLGVEKFLNYKTEDYTKAVANVDAVIDTIGGEETVKQLSILKDGGEIVSLKGMPNREFAKKMNMGLAKELLFNVAARKIEKEAKKRNQNYHFIFVQANGQQLKEAAKILEKNQIHPLIGNQYSLTKVNAALADVAQRKSLGKVIINF
ncbi:NADP-dependent oxidoreductase [Lactobacillus johnsonii]|uniref:Oxidoreductase n=1 Tax=Lactobacillus johnsonii TaxID=33959 RepID=A0A9X0LY89_LACJH|nr:NADP-dependent oxidoreductase [Lactobacillus johnsonii]KXN76688.1 oxidoreductase [Lactobacillus johnsonii]